MSDYARRLVRVHIVPSFKLVHTVRYPSVERDNALCMHPYDRISQASVIPQQQFDTDICSSIVLVLGHCLLGGSTTTTDVVRRLTMKWLAVRCRCVGCICKSDRY